MRTIIVGKGIQGLKRQKHCGEDFTGFVDPAYVDQGSLASIFDVPLDFYDAAIICVPYAQKFGIAEYCLTNGKHVMMEKPLTIKQEEFSILQKLCDEKQVVLYTAYNHRFEPHFIRMKWLLETGQLGQIYSVRMFYGNGTAQNVKGTWRDKSILQEIGTHLLDTCKWWNSNLPAPQQATFSRSETDTADYLLLQLGGEGTAPVILEMSWISWRNTFRCDIIGSKGSAHIDGLCKWGPSTFTHRHRVFPSGKPIEESFVLEQEDPTWRAEYAFFKSLIETKQKTDLTWDAELMRTIEQLERGI